MRDFFRERSEQVEEFFKTTGPSEQKFFKSEENQRSEPLARKKLFLVFPLTEKQNGSQARAMTISEEFMEALRADR